MDTATPTYYGSDLDIGSDYFREFSANFFVSPDGLKAYTIYKNNNDPEYWQIGQWSMSTPWDHTTLSGTNPVASFNLTLPVGLGPVMTNYGDPTKVYAFCFNATGTKLYVVYKANTWVTSSASKIITYNLSSPYDVSTLSVESDSTFAFEVFDDATFVYERGNSGYFTDIHVSPDGTKLFLLSPKWPRTNVTIYQFSLSPSGEINQTIPTTKHISTFHNDPSYITKTGTQYGQTPYMWNFAGVRFSPDGMKMFTGDTTSAQHNIVVHNLATPFDISTASYSLTKSGILSSGQNSSFCFSSDGTKLFVGASGISGALLVSHTLSSAWDVTSVTGSVSTYLIGSGAGGKITSMSFSPAGDRIIFSTYQGLFYTDLSSPWDILSNNGATTIVDPYWNGPNSFVEIIGEYPEALYNTYGYTYEVYYDFSFVSSDGTKLYAHNQAHIYEFNINDAWNGALSGSSITYTGRRAYIGHINIAGQMYFTDDMSHLYITSCEQGRVYQYDLIGNTLIDAYSDTDSGFVNTEDGGDTNPYTNDQKMAYTVQPGDALAPGHYYWRARGKDPSGSNTWGDWSEVREFDIAFTPGVVYDNVNLTEGLRVYREFGREPRGPQKYRNRATHADILGKTHQATGSRVVW
jgi:hypothetical protein